MATERRPHVVRVFEHDKSKPLEPGKNPLPLFQIEVEFATTVPRRERAAIAAVRTKTGRDAGISHCPNGDMVATVTTQSAATVHQPQQGQFERMLKLLMQSPTVQAEFQRIMAQQQPTAKLA